MKSVFADTFYFLALLNERDPFLGSSLLIDHALAPRSITAAAKRPVCPCSARCEKNSCVIEAVHIPAISTLPTPTPVSMRALAAHRSK